jgi:hypothetical protein
MGLLAAGLDAHPAVTRAVQFLVDRQQADGTWEETEFTGTGFPRVFYLRYHYYPIYFPLMALSRWAQSAAATSAEASLTSLQRTVSAPKAESECRRRQPVAPKQQQGRPCKVALSLRERIGHFRKRSAHGAVSILLFISRSEMATLR